MTAGLQRGDLIVVAGRPSMGKTSLAINIAENASIGHEIPTAIFSMEMSAEQLSFRMISSIGRVNQSRLRTGKPVRGRLAADQLCGIDDVQRADLHRRHTSVVAN